jgi:hypothetical protein
LCAFANAGPDTSSTFTRHSQFSNKIPSHNCGAKTKFLRLSLVISSPCRRSCGTIRQLSGKCHHRIPSSCGTKLRRHCNKISKPQAYPRFMQLSWTWWVVLSALSLGMLSTRDVRFR